MSIFDGVSLSVLQTRLSAAQDAYHALNTGQQAVSLGIGDKRITFTAADVRRLASYINQLQVAISVLAGTSTGSPVSVATWTR